MKVKISRLHPNAKLPQYAHGSDEDAGMDLCSTIDFEMEEGWRGVVPTGIAIELPPGYEAQIRSRSGLAASLGVAVLNAPGTIDPSYRGEIRVILINHGPQRVVIRAGEKIAQMVIAKYEAVEWEEGALGESARGTDGFGSTEKSQ